MSKRGTALLLCLVLLGPPAFPAAKALGESARTLPVAEYRDKMRAGWLGKMVGVSTGILREFWYRGELGPEDQAPEWHPSLLSLACVEDDLYVPFVMLQQLDRRGIGLSAREMAIALYPYSFEFWNGHLFTFECGIAPPDAGHPRYAPYPDALSYSFAADYSGLIAPGCPDIPAALADRYARMLVYGDGVYGGAYIGALYSEAFFSKDPVQIVQSALAVLPPDSWMREAIADTLACYRRAPGDWEGAWEIITQKYFLRADYNWIQWPYGGRTKGIGLDAKLNCAYVTLALLFGGGDIERTLHIAIRCGQDCDCNAANALGVLFTTMGWDALPEAYKRAADALPNFRYADAAFDELVAVTERVATETLLDAGATLEGEVWLLPERPAYALPLENSKKPGALADSLFTPEEMARMGKPALQDGGFEADWHEEVYPPWMISGNGSSGIDLRQGKAYAGVNNAWLSAAPHQDIALSQHRVFVEPGTRYTLACAARSSANFERGELAVYEAGEGGKLIAQTDIAPTADYAVTTLAFDTGGASIVDIRIGYTGGAAVSWMQIDQVSLEIAR